MVRDVAARVARIRAAMKRQLAAFGKPKARPRLYFVPKTRNLTTKQRVNRLMEKYTHGS